MTDFSNFKVTKLPSTIGRKRKSLFGVKPSINKGLNPPTNATEGRFEGAAGDEMQG